ncbi:MAG: hypothetical protein IKW92_05440 [Firmicutes bacterium]|nr:hypothetical protein [Bacillota bacterium]
MELTPAQNLLYEQLWQVPPNLPEAEKLLSSGEYSPEDVTIVALLYVEECFEDGLARSALTDETKPIKPSPYDAGICSIIKLLLPYGLDPDAVIYGHNILWDLKYIRTPYISADALRLLLAAGGNPDLDVVGGNLIEQTCFDIWCDTTGQRDRTAFDCLVHYWMVLIGYYADRKPDDFPLALCIIANQYPFDPTNLKNHEDYFFGLTLAEKDQRTIRVFDKKSFWEVARY